MAAAILTACKKAPEQTDQPEPPVPPAVEETKVTTSAVTDIEETAATAGGSITGAETSDIESVGIEYMEWDSASSAMPSENEWSAGAATLAGDIDTTWSVVMTDLTPAADYAVRAWASVGGKRYCGAAARFSTLAPAPPVVRDPLSAAELRRYLTEGKDPSEERVAGVIAAAYEESLADGLIYLYDNTARGASAIAFRTDTKVDVRRGDEVVITLTTAVVREGDMPCYAGIAESDIVVGKRGVEINPLWLTAADAADVQAAWQYICTPVRISNVYAATPALSFSAPDNTFTDGEACFTVYAAADSEAGRLAPNAATGTIYGIYNYTTRPVVTPLSAADVESFTGESGIAEGEASLTIRNLVYDRLYYDRKTRAYAGHFQFPEQGGTRQFDMEVAAPAGMRLFADTRPLNTGLEANHFDVLIEGSHVSVTARPNVSGEDIEGHNLYLYLASERDGQRMCATTITLSQVGSRYSSTQGLISVYETEADEYAASALAAVHRAEIEGREYDAMKLGSGNYTGYYRCNPVAVEGNHTLHLYAMGWNEKDHPAGKLYIKVEGGGYCGVESISLTTNEGATGIAPFALTLGEEYRFEIPLYDLTPCSTLWFSTSPDFVYESDKKTGRALLTGLWIE